MDVRKIVNCTPEQYMTLLKEGQVEIDGEIKVKEEGALYNTGELSLLEWHNKIMEAQYKEVKPEHTQVVTKPLENEIADIILEYPDYKDSSVVAFSAFLHNGDTIEVANTKNNGEWFINGKSVTTNYTYTGNDTELVNVVVFETGYYSDKAAWGIRLNTTPTYYPFEIIIRSLNLLPEVEKNYYLFAENITTYAFNLAAIPRSARIIKADGTNDFTQKTSPAVQEISSNCDQFTTSFKGNAYIETIKLPNCKTLSGADRGIFMNCTNLRNWEFGKLTTISNITNANPGYLMFSNTHTVYIPETVNTIQGIICYNNENLILDCNRATSIYDGWCNRAPVNFTMAKNWDASINIAVAAKNWSKDKFIELFEDLVPLSEMLTSRELTIPAAIFDSLTEEEYAIAEDKGWVLGGA